MDDELYFEDLPDEIIADVFERTSNMRDYSSLSQSNRRIRNIAYDSSINIPRDVLYLSKVKDFIPYKLTNIHVVIDKLEWSKLQYIYNKDIRSISFENNISDFRIESDYDDIIEIFKTNPKIENIKMKTEDYIVEQIAEFCHNIKNINLRGSYLITNESIYSLIETNDNIEDINISHTLVDGEGLLSIAAGCPNLKKIDVSYMGQCDRSSPIEDNYYGVAAILDNTNITTLYINNLRMNDEVLGDLSLHCHNLKSISIESNSITTEGVIKFLTENKQLEEIYIGHNYKVTVRAIYHIIDKMNKITKLGVKNMKITDDILNDIIVKFENLVYLDITDTIVTDQGIISLVNFYISIGRILPIQLYIPGTHGEYNDPTIDYMRQLPRGSKVIYNYTDSKRNYRTGVLFV